MIKISIGTADRQYENIRDIEENWINQQINRRKDDGQNVCVQVAVEQVSINIRLSTPACAVSGGGRPPNQQERAIFELWNKHDLNTANFSGGNVIAFFKQLKKVIN